MPKGIRKRAGASPKAKLYENLEFKMADGGLKIHLGLGDPINGHHRRSNTKILAKNDPKNWYYAKILTFGH